MNRKFRGLIFTIPGILIGAIGATSCNKLAEAAGEICGPCGDVTKGDFSVSGNAQVDGFFQAVGNLQNATLSVQGDFQANILALAGVYDVDAKAGFSAALVDSVIAAIQADVKQNLQGGISVNYKPPQCQASVDVAVSAQAQWEARKTELENRRLQGLTLESLRAKYMKLETPGSVSLHQVFFGRDARNVKGSYSSPSKSKKFY